MGQMIDDDRIAPSLPSTDHNTTVRPDHLNRDILWLIFNNNCDTLISSNALETTRRSSQVCKDWRSVILDASSLWGKLIDIDAPDLRRDEWRNEVLRRSKNSPLWITGRTSLQRHSTSAPFSPLEQFFFLNQHWSRIERLRVSVGLGLSDPSFWHAVHNPAPLLQIFELRFPHEVNLIPPIPPIFANHAPLLQTFHATAAIQYSTPWLSNIRSLQFWPHSCSYSDIYQLLALTPRLEHLDLLALSQADVSLGNIGPLDLPYLSSVSLSASMTQHISLLRCMANVRGSSIRTFRATIQRSGFEDRDNLAELCQVLSRFIDNHFSADWPTTVELRFSPIRFCWQSETNTGSFLWLSIPLHDDILEVLVDKFRLASFKTVIEIGLRLTIPRPAQTIDGNYYLYSFFSFFPSLKTLCIWKATLPSLLSLFNEASTPLFPHLEAVKFFSGSGIMDQRELHKILSRCRDDGHSILVLDLAECYRSEESLHIFEDMVGMKTLWRQPGVEGILEHICGSGILQTLENFD